MSDSGVRPFLCQNIDKALLRGEWEKWLRSLELYLAAEEINDCVKKRNKLLHLGGTQLQEVAYNIPGAIETYNSEQNNDIFKVLVENMNKSLVKRLQIAHANKVDYKSESQKYILMFNVTPQGTTGKSPSELLFNRNIRDKIPSISDLMTETVDEEALDNDILNKQKGKEKEDKSRGAKEHNIEPGDKVLIENMVTPHKLTRYEKNEYEVINICENEATLMRDGKILKRHVSQLKKVPDTPKQQPITSSSHNALPMSSSPTDGKPGQPEEEEPELPGQSEEKKETLMEKDHLTKAASDDPPQNSAIEEKGRSVATGVYVTRHCGLTEELQPRGVDT